MTQDDFQITPTPATKQELEALQRELEGYVTQAAKARGNIKAELLERIVALEAAMHDLSQHELNPFLHHAHDAPPVEPPTPPPGAAARAAAMNAAMDAWAGNVNPIDSRLPASWPMPPTDRPVVTFADLGVSSIYDAVGLVPDGHALFVPKASYNFRSGPLRPLPHRNLIFEAGSRIIQNTEHHVFDTSGLEDAVIEFNKAEIYKGVHPGRGGGSIIKPQSAPMNGVVIRNPVVRSADGWQFVMIGKHLVLIGAETYNRDAPGSTNIDDGADLAGQHIAVLDGIFRTHDDGNSLKNFSVSEWTEDIWLIGNDYQSRDAGVTWGSAEVRRGIRDFHLLDNVSADCGSPMYFKNYSNDQRTWKFGGHYQDGEVRGWHHEGDFYRLINFFTRYPQNGGNDRWNKTHDIDFENIVATGKPVQWGTQQGQAGIFHAERQGPNLNGLADVVWQGR